MLTISLPRLERERSLEIRASVAPDDPMWIGSDLVFTTAMSVEGTAQALSGGDVLVRLLVRAQLRQECRRCLDPVTIALEERLELLYVPEGGPEGALDVDARFLPGRGVGLNLAEAIREEVILSQSPFALCRPDCRGLCPRCGANRNREICNCSMEERDPRWDTLRALTDE